jgi:hypothetical protein
MSAEAQKILDDALSLSPKEQEMVFNGLLTSLRVVDPAIDEAWVREVEDRIAAYDAGEMEAYDAEEVLAEFLVK